MKYCRFLLNNTPRFGLVETEGTSGRELITRVFADDPYARIPDLDAASKRIDPIRLEEAKLLAPVIPSKIICVGRNYRAHAAELGNEVPVEPLLFFKPPSAINDPEGKIVCRRSLASRFDYEGELGVVIGKTCSRLSEQDEVRDYIFGYTCVNDFTARDLQKKDGQWTRAKGFDTFCPVGPVVVDGLDPWAGVEVETRVNGEQRQHGNTNDFIFTLEVVLRYVSAVFTLLPGDLIATGTPEGVGPVNAGDVIEVSVAGVGTLRNSVIDE
jgi:2-keto-4-pentenoate hydratase/2-oxohepta-3-ene-1,7-dioic acid hydratase in catechol pathway